MCTAVQAIWAFGQHVARAENLRSSICLQGEPVPRLKVQRGTKSPPLGDRHIVETTAAVSTSFVVSVSAKPRPPCSNEGSITYDPPTPPRVCHRMRLNSHLSPPTCFRRPQVTFIDYLSGNTLRETAHLQRAENRSKGPTKAQSTEVGGGPASVHPGLRG